MCFSSISDLIEDIKAGKMVVLVDDEDRENEGDLVCAAEKTTPEIINFMATHGRGMICMPLTGEKCDQLNLHPQTANNTAALGTAFTVTIDARTGITTGISAADRCRTILQAVNDDCKPSDLARPGHIFPLRARDGGVLTRSGQTEGSIDLARLAGLKSAGVICEIMNDDGTMARRNDLITFCKQHHLKMGTIADLIEYRLKGEQLVKRLTEVDMPTDFGTFKLIAYGNGMDNKTHLALVKGDLGKQDEFGQPIEQDDTILMRVHSECFTGDVFMSQRCDCGKQLHQAMQKIDQVGKGAIIYLRQEGRGIGLAEKLRAYKLQEEGMDTVDANVALGYPPDKRDYGLGAQICRDLGIRRIAIMTNNPIKSSRLSVYGITVVEQIPLEIECTVHNKRYMQTKRDRMGHILPNLESPK